MTACPICQKPTAPTYKPFCSKRCADIDLNRWFSGTYAIPAPVQDEEAEHKAYLEAVMDKDSLNQQNTGN